MRTDAPAASGTASKPGRVQETPRCAKEGKVISTRKLEVEGLFPSVSVACRYRRGGPVVT